MSARSRLGLASALEETMGTTGYLWDERFCWFDATSALEPGPHREPYPALDRPECRRRIDTLVRTSGLIQRLRPLRAREASDEELLRFHHRDYIERIDRLGAAAGGRAGDAARFGAGGHRIARLAAGGCIVAAEAVAGGDVQTAYALVRPAGHHATATAGGGFCIYSNIVIALRHLQHRHQLGRVAVVDWDVHHGNGTQEAFYGDDSVLTLSIHQDSAFPAGSGAIDEVGEGRGRGYNINVALPPGSGHGAYLACIERVVLPALRAYRPEMILIACGLDAAANDPLGRMLCTAETFRAMAAMVREAADVLCDGRLLACHEGGYSPTYAPYCGLAVLEALSGHATAVSDPLGEHFAQLGGQALQPHQAAAIDTIAHRVAQTGL